MSGIEELSCDICGEKIGRPIEFYVDNSYRLFCYDCAAAEGILDEWWQEDGQNGS